MSTPRQFLDVLLAHDITEEYDHLEALSTREMPGEILHCVEAARAALWQARMLAEEKAGMRDA